jgi:acyl dehydratase
MPIDYEKLRNWQVPEVRQRLTQRDTMLYALGLGLGADPMDRDQLRFVYERDLAALPTMAVVLCQPIGWTADPETGIDRTGVVHGEQGFTIHRRLPVEGELRSTTRVVEVVDKGAGKGALILTETRVYGDGEAAPLATLASTTFARRDGGFGGPSRSPHEPHRLPERDPDLVDDWPVIPQLALIYRLSGDYNPLHADPDYAARAGFRQPILHGRATFGIAGIALLRRVCGWDPARLVSMQARFSSPVYPGDTIRTAIWLDGTQVSFRCTVPARGVTVLDHGRAVLGPALQG